MVVLVVVAAATITWDWRIDPNQSRVALHSMDIHQTEAREKVKQEGKMK